MEPAGRELVVDGRLGEAGDREDLRQAQDALGPGFIHGGWYALHVVDEAPPCHQLGHGLVLSPEIAGNFPPWLLFPGFVAVLEGHACDYGDRFPRLLSTLSPAWIRGRQGLMPRTGPVADGSFAGWVQWPYLAADARLPGSCDSRVPQARPTPRGGLSRGQSPTWEIRSSTTAAFDHPARDPHAPPPLAGWGRGRGMRRRGGLERYVVKSTSPRRSKGSPYPAVAR